MPASVSQRSPRPNCCGGIALSYRTSWPLGFYVGVAAGFILLGQAWTGLDRRPPTRVPSARGARAQFSPLIPNGWWFLRQATRQSERVAASACNRHPFG